MILLQLLANMSLEVGELAGFGEPSVEEGVVNSSQPENDDDVS